MQDVRQPCWTHQRTIWPDRVMTHQLMRVHQRHGVWTWLHCWPAEETVYAQLPATVSQTRYPLSGEWLMDVRGYVWLPWHAARSCLD